MKTGLSEFASNRPAALFALAFASLAAFAVDSLALRAASFARASSASASCSMRSNCVEVLMGCSLKSEGTVRTESLSTSIRELVDGDSVVSTWGGAGARFWMECQSKEAKEHLLRASRSFIDE